MDNHFGKLYFRPMTFYKASNMRPITCWADYTMTPIRICIFLVSVSLLTGCEPSRASSASAEQRKAVLADEEAFAKIVDYYQKMFPTASFSDGRNIHESDGPNGERLHINVPLAVDAEYQHPFAPAFLAEQSRSPDGRVRMIAGELLLLRSERLFTHSARVSYDGQTHVDCITYVVSISRSK